MTKDENTQTRREVLHSVGDIGGTAAVYQAMISMGLLMPGDAAGAELRNQWVASANQITTEVKPRGGRCLSAASQIEADRQIR